MAYQAFPRSKELVGGNYRVIVEFVSDTPLTEPTFSRELMITPAMTVQNGREWVYEQITNAKPKKSVADLIVLNAAVAPLEPVPPAPTAARVWRDKADRLARAKALGLTNVTAVADVATLEADVNATYATGFLDGA